MNRIDLNAVKNNKAVTMVEMMVVLGIISVMLGVSAPTFFNYQHTLKLRSAARELASDIRYARQLAVTTNTTHRLCFDGSIQYMIYRNTTCGGTIVKTVNMAQVYSGVTQTGGATLTFTSLGTVSPPDTAFTLTKGDIIEFSTTKTVTVSGVGNVTIQ